MERTPAAAGRFSIKLSPEELEDFRENTGRATELGVSASEILHGSKTQTETISETERLIGGVHHAVLSENMTFEEAEARLKLIAELNASEHPAEDK